MAISGTDCGYHRRTVEWRNVMYGVKWMKFGKDQVQDEIDPAPQEQWTRLCV
jgi:hypothetical protein